MVRTRNKAKRNRSEFKKCQNLKNQEPEPGTLFLVGSCFLPGSFGFIHTLVTVAWVLAGWLVVNSDIKVQLPLQLPTGTELGKKSVKTMDSFASTEAGWTKKLELTMAR